MAILTILDQDGKPALVHSSIFDGAARKIERAAGQWSQVWARVDAPSATTPEAPPLKSSRAALR